LGASAWAIAANSDGRTAGFVALIVSNLMVLLTSRTETRAWWRGGVTTNRSVWVLFSATLAALSVTLFVPSVRQLFGFQALKTLELLGATAMGALPVIVGDLLVRAFRAARRRVAPTRMRVGQT
jgi:Ca2+-transporting ATPase